ncbi:MAG: VanZ family protein [Lachnospiraceae bacterium]|nr:VanZ family protein [Lachnospiraceae bacterium]
MKILNKIFFTLTIIWMIVIFIFSAQSGDTSGNMSGGLTDFIVSIIYSDFEEFSPETQIEILDTFHYIIRKGAHFTEFAILGLLSLLTILTRIYSKNDASFSNNNKHNLLKSGIISFVFSAFYAITDEVHQNFVSDRAPAIKDVLIDSSGALAGILFTSLMFYLFYIKKDKKRTDT